MKAASTIAAPKDSGGAAAGYHVLVMGRDLFVTRPLPQVGQVILGRSDGADVPIDDPKASRRHACLRALGGGRFEIEDLGSANGTRVRDARLDPRRAVPLTAGEAVAIGDLVVMVRPDGGRSRHAGAAPSRDAAPSTVRPRFDGAGEPMRAALALAERAATADINVLLLGETGVGKDVVARLIHGKSARRGKPFVSINCAALAESLLESELFGHEKGAYTGAGQEKPGLLEAASGGTAFLDEVGELPPATQAKLLHVLEHRQVTRVGGVKPRRLDVRFVAATNRDLEADVARKAFRADLFFRLAGLCIELPPLRERRDEIPGLARSLLAQACRAQRRRSAPDLSPAAVEKLCAHAWPGNVRELRNVIEQAALLCDGDEIGPAHLRLGRKDAAPVAGDERARVEGALQACAGNQTQAAKLLGVSRKVLIARLDAFGLARPRKGRRG